MEGSDKARRPKPGDDPLEFDWPDDAKELRAAEREAGRKRADIRPVPRFLTAYLVGTWTVLTFILIGAVAFQGPQLFVSYAAPVAVIGLVAALPLGMVLNALTRRLQAGFVSLSFMIVGGVFGYVWTYAVLGWIQRVGGATFGSTSEDEGFRTAVSVFMMTASMCAFVIARNMTDKARMYPKPIITSLIVLLIVGLPSLVLAVSDIHYVLSN